LKLYDHAVNKISYIAKDPTDNRAFGYIYTETKGKHMYFGIKTDRPVCVLLSHPYYTILFLVNSWCSM